MTRTPASTSAGANSAAAVSGSARNTTWASCASVSAAPRTSGVIVPFHTRASAGSLRGAAPGAFVDPDDVAAVIRTAGCRASSRSSSWPV